MTLNEFSDTNNFKLGFPLKDICEGKICFRVPRSNTFIRGSKESREETPLKAPVFFNPIMELNRDITVLACQIYQRMIDRKVSVCEPFTGCGVRGLRLATEVDGLQSLVLGDINPTAFQLAKQNVMLNKLENQVTVMNEDANLLISRYAKPKKRFDMIDIDPFGSPVPYLDSAIRGLHHGGLLALTATDMAPLCGVHPQACIRKYGGKPLRTEYCHELAIRLLIGCLAMTAARHEIGVNVVFSHSTHHYIRAYCLVNRGVKHADRSIQRMGYIFHCFNCLHREFHGKLTANLDWRCSQCGSIMSTAGPLWLGKISDEDFSTLMIEEALRRRLKLQIKILKMLSLIKSESKGPITYYVIDKFCDKLNQVIPPSNDVIERLKKAGFEATFTHFHNKGFRTNAPVKIIAGVLEDLNRN